MAASAVNPSDGADTLLSARHLVKTYRAKGNRRVQALAGVMEVQMQWTSRRRSVLIKLLPPLPLPLMWQWRPAAPQRKTRCLVQLLWR